MAESASTEPSGFVKRSFGKRPQGRQVSKRQKDDSEDDSSEDETQIIRKEKKFSHNPLVQKTVGRVKSKLSADDEDDGGQAKDDKRKEFAFAAERSTARMGPGDMGATATVEIDTPHDQDAQALFEKSQTINAEMKDKDDDNVYRGMNNYKQFLPKKGNSQGNASSGMVRKGPIRAPTNVRASVRWDYAPDICKDYKETGFCGFGDSCIFLHDRSDYKHGWQLEREVDKKTYGQNDADSKKYEIPSDDEDNLPFKCLICRESFKSPVVTKCKHYFCESCALSNYKKSKRCFACGQQTMGVFNPAKDLAQKIKKKEDAGEVPDDAPEDEEQVDEKAIKMLHHDHSHPHSSADFGGPSDPDVHDDD